MRTFGLNKNQSRETAGLKNKTHIHRTAIIRMVHRKTKQKLNASIPGTAKGVMQK